MPPRPILYPEEEPMIKPASAFGLCLGAAVLAGGFAGSSQAEAALFPKIQVNLQNGFTGTCKIRPNTINKYQVNLYAYGVFTVRKRLHPNRKYYAVLQVE